MKYEHSCQLGSQRNWAGPGSMLNFGIVELKLQNFVHSSMRERDSNVDFETFGSCIQVKTMATL